MAFIKKRTLANGKVAYQVRYRDPDHHKELSRQFARMKDAQDFLHNVEADKSRGAWIDPARGKVTVSDFAAIWLAGRVDLRASSYARVKRVLETRVLPRFGAVALADLTHAEVQAWAAELTRSGLAPRTVWKYVGALHSVMDMAVKDRRIVVNPAAGLRLPKPVKAEMRCLSPREIATLVDACEPEWFAVLVQFSAYTGLRIGETLGLRWGRVNLLARTVDVTEAAVEVEGKIVLGPPKTEAGYRTVPMPAFVAHALAGLVDCAPELDAFVFSNRHGQPFLSSGLRRTYWRPAVNRSGLGAVRLHDLRHTAVSLWIASGLHDPKELQTRAGHESITTLFDTYGHLLPGHEHTGMDALNAMGLAAGQATPTHPRASSADTSRA